MPVARMCSGDDGTPPKLAFNSLFEMRTPLKAGVYKMRDTFNSLFEMPVARGVEPLAQAEVLLSILYLRCLTNMA